MTQPIDTERPHEGCRICLQPSLHDIRCRLAKGLDSPVLDSERVNAAVHQVAQLAPPQCATFSAWGGYQCALKEGHEGTHRHKYDPLLPAPPTSEQDVAPGRRYESSDGRKWSDTRMSDTDVEYIAAAPIQAAVEACEANQMGQFSDYIHVRKSDWNALVKSVKGEK